MRTLVTLSVSTAFLAVPLAAQNGFFQTGLNSAPGGLSADGAVAAGTVGAQYFTWTEAGGVTPIGAISGTTPGQTGISDAGTRISGVTLNPATNAHEMSMYSTSSGTWTLLGAIGAPCGSDNGSGWGISGDGLSVVGLGWLGCTEAHAIQWKQSTGVTADLGSTVPGRSSRANDTNLDGSVVVGWQDSSTGFRQGAVWVNGAQTLVTLAGTGDMLGEASGCSADGAWVVGSGVAANSFQAYRWSAGTLGQSLGTLPGITNPRSAATGISADGKLIVGWVRPFASPPISGEGFLWREDLGMVNLTTWAQEMGVALPAGTVLALPLAISDDGKVICGQARVGATAQGFVLRIDELSASQWTISQASGGSQSLALKSAPAHAGKLYFALGSLSGTTPGLPAGGFTLPLNLDAYLQFTLGAPNQPPLAASLGFLNGSAQAAASVTLPAGFDASLIGLSAHHAYAVLDIPGTAAILDTSNAVSLKLVP